MRQIISDIHTRRAWLFYIASAGSFCAAALIHSGIVTALVTLGCFLLVAAFISAALQ